MKKAVRHVPILLSFLLVGMAGGPTGPSPIPLRVSDACWRPLCNIENPTLQRDLKQALRKNRLWRSLLEKKKMAVGVIDLADPQAPRFAQINGRAMMYAASLPKIAVLLAAHVCFEDGTLQPTPPVHDDLLAMTRVSSNSAATRLIQRIGLRRIEEILLDPRYRLYDLNAGGGIWVGKAYAAAGEIHPDPIKGLSHAANVNQVCRFYYLLANARLINAKRSRQMLEILSSPGLHTKFVGAMEQIAPGAHIYRKSGTWRVWHSDSMLVWDELWRRYILVSMVEHPQGERVLRELVPVVEQILEPKNTILVANPTVSDSLRLR